MFSNFCHGLFRPSSVWRVLGQAGLLSKCNGKPAEERYRPQPLAVHQHWHIDVPYINIGGTFYCLCSILHGFSRYIVNWDIRESMTEADIVVILERAKELHSETKSRIISDNGPQFIAKDFKEFIRISGMTPRQNFALLSPVERKIERWPNPSKESASGRQRHRRWKMRGVCRRTSSPGVSRRSIRRGMGKPLSRDSRRPSPPSL
ncbi:MAG: transposase family protein [Acidobacteria bacterium]|nr:transposase family protein [Acidobacteriota bacterium]